VLTPRALRNCAPSAPRAGASARPLSFTVRRMSTPFTHRLIALLIGLALLAYCGYKLYTGQARGAWRSWYRDEQPWSYWTSMVLKLAIAGAFLFGFTTWRN